MDYKVLAKESLSGYRVLCAAIENLRQSIRDIDSRLSSAELACKEHQEERISLFGQRAHLESILTYRLSGKERIDRGLSVLTQEQRTILDRFYIHRTDRYLDELMDELGYERRSIYYHHNAALRDFTVAMYGLSED